MPIEDAADEGRDQEHRRVGAGRRLGQREQQGQIAVDMLALEGFGRSDAFEGRGDLDQDAVTGDAAGLIRRDHGAGLVDGRTGVEGKIRIDLGRHPAGHELGEFGAERHRKPVAHGGGDRIRVAALAAAPGHRLLDEVRIGPPPP